MTSNATGEGRRMGVKKKRGGRERARWDSNPRMTDLQSVPLDHLGTRPSVAPGCPGPRGKGGTGLWHPTGGVSTGAILLTADGPSGR